MVGLTLGTPRVRDKGPCLDCRLDHVLFRRTPGVLHCTVSSGFNSTLKDPIRLAWAEMLVRGNF